MILTVNDLSKSYGTDIILDGLRFQVGPGERVGIIGRNGAGKSTLLRILAGDEAASSGGFRVRAGSRVGFLRQDAGDIFGQEETTVIGVMRAAYERLAASGAEVYESEVRGILRSMAFTDAMMDSPAIRLSGGEKTRLAFAVLLLEKPDIMLLDEPTNHLDIGTQNWLEQKLAAWKGTVLLVTHDRYFLDRTVNRIFEIENHRLKIYTGTYSVYAEQKRLQREIEFRAWENQQAEIRRQEDMIRKMKERGTEKLAKRAASREKRLAGVERVERPESEQRALSLRFDEITRSGDDALNGEGLSKSFGYPERRLLFENVNFDIKRGERVCLVGANGIGKTTLLRMILGRTAPDEGNVRKGVNVRIGYFEQEQRFQDSGRSVLDEMTSAYRSYSETEMRGILARFLFTGDMVFREISALSGGERAKLSLVKLILSGANTLLLDEPTNHLDIPSREAIEDALLEFPGTLLIVSHDRYFLNKIPTHIAELTSEGLVFYSGNYDYYTDKKDSAGSGASYLKSLFGESPDTFAREPSEAEQVRRRKKQEETERRRKEKAFAALEARIMEIESQIERTESDLKMPEVMNDTAKLHSKTELLDLLHRALATKYAEWERWG
jgi:ATP-binding cassette subfamily F protein 3